MRHCQAHGAHCWSTKERPVARHRAPARRGAGMSLGMVVQLPEADETSVSRRQLLAHLDVFMGGRVAEEIIFGAGDVTTGASSDLDKVGRPRPARCAACYTCARGDRLQCRARPAVVWTLALNCSALAGRLSPGY